MNGDPCQPLADNLNQLEADVQSLRDSLKDASSPEKQDLLRQIRAADQQIISARSALEECRKTHPIPSGPPSLTSTFTGIGTINVASGQLPDPITQPVSFTLVFEGSEVRMLTFDPLMITDPHQITVTMTGSQLGSFDSNTGMMIVPVTFLFDLGLILGQYTLAFAPPLMTTGQQTPPVDMRYSPMGMRLNFQTGSVALAGAGYFTDSNGNQSDAAQLVFNGTLSPLPVSQPRPRRRTAIEEIDTKAR
jgi:hypothetical protein